MTTYANRSNAVRAARAKYGKAAEAGIDFEITGSAGAFSFAPLPSHLTQQAVTKIEVIAEPVFEPDVQHPLSGGTDDALEIPAVLKISAADRAAAWERNPPKPAISFSKPKLSTPKAEKALRENKIGAVIAKLKANGVSVPEIHEMTGWKKIGGFYTAAQRAGITLAKSRVDGVTVYRAA